MRRWLHSLGARLLIGASVLILIAMVVTGAVMAFALRHFIQAQVDGRLDGQIMAVADALRPGPGGLRLERLVDGPPFDRPHSGWGWQVTGAGPTLRSRSLMGDDMRFGAAEDPPGPPPEPPRPDPGAGPGPDGPAPDPRAKPDTVFGTGPGEDALRGRMRVVAVGPAIVTIVAAAPEAALSGPLREAMTPVMVALGFLAVLLVGGGVLQVWLGLRPLGLLDRELRAVRDGRAERITGPQPTEIRPLVKALNTLIDQHAANLERARRHVANLAHSLKTPLATLTVTMDEPGRDPDGTIRPLVAGMDRMIRHHLARARAAALGGTTRARVALEPRIADHLTAFRRLYADKPLTVALDVSPTVMVACEPQDLDEVLGNLLDNACRWTTGRLAIRAVTEGQRVRLAIEDDGPGLPDGRADDVLRPGRRLDESSPGYGFGLPIARELTELYGGTIVLGRSILGGLAVSLDLPRAG